MDEARRGEHRIYLVAAAAEVMRRLLMESDRRSRLSLSPTLRAVRLERYDVALADRTNRNEQRRFIEQAAGGDWRALQELLSRHRERPRREEASRGEAAAVLGVDESAASKCYARALVRLEDILAGLSGA
jgi:hypothetical protein